MAIEINHSHADGTLVHGTARGGGASHVIKATRDGWKFSRNIGAGGAWYLPHSRDRNADGARIERLAAALREAGHEVSVEVDDTRRPVVDTEADRADRVAGRVERYDELAAARHASGGARLAQVRERRSHIPLGQPVISERFGNLLRRLNRTEDSARREIEVGDHWQARAEAAESTQRYRHNPGVIQRRLDRLEADQRRRHRRVQEYRSGGAHGQYAPGGQYAGQVAAWVERVEQEIRTEQETIDYWRGQLGQHRVWSREHFRSGDWVEGPCRGDWHEVRRVNAKSVTVPHPIRPDLWTSTLPYDKVLGRRRDRDGAAISEPPVDEEHRSEG